MTNGTQEKAGSGSCTQCGKPLPRNAPGGLCPACLMGQGMRLITTQRAQAVAFTPVEADEVALLFPEIEVRRCIGRGGMGAVYEGRQRDLDRIVAIKVLPPEVGADPEFTERFRREAATLAHLDHPNIVRLFGYGQREDCAFLVMEFVEGEDLARRVASGRMEAREACAIVSQLCDALEHSHQRGVVHRDIKPANILISREGRVKVADFGLARLVRPDVGDLGLTRTQASLGTPRYMAPEQMAGKGVVDHRADIYAVGVVLYEMLTGQLPAGHFEPPSRVVPSLNPRLDEVTLKALNADPNRRFASALEVKRRLQEALEHPAPTRDQARRALAWRVFWFSVLAAVAGAGAVLVWTAVDGAGRRPTSEQGKAASTTAREGGGRLVAFGIQDAALPAGRDQVVSVAIAAAREEFGLMLRADGTIASWGPSRFGQTDIPSGLQDAVAVVAGQGPRSAHALALRGDGTVVGWGDNTYRQARPPPELGPVKAVTAGELSSLALTRDGRVVAWGNQDGLAASVPLRIGTVSAMAAGANFSVVLLTNGVLAAWGENSAGECEVPTPEVKIVEIAAGTHHGVARLKDGRVLAWGDNRSGQCRVPSLLPPAARIFAGGESSAAVDTAGKLHVWGKVPAGMETYAGRVAAVAFGTSVAVVVEAAP